MCVGCMACVDSCPKNAITVEPGVQAYNAIIDDDKCVNCNLCKRVCQNNTLPEFMLPKWWYQGWAKDSEIRSKCTSGGFATAIAKKFAIDGGVVVSCRFLNGQFRFCATEDPYTMEMFSGSKYVKSNAVESYKLVKKNLMNDKKVLFIGLPCQIAAVKNFVEKNLQENLYTIDLICHGTPSPIVLKSFLKQYGLCLDQMKEIKFRNKFNYNITNEDKQIASDGVIDCYTMTFLKGMTYTENCYSCKYAQINRVSDITLGDSWGSELDILEQKRGISLALCQTEKGIKILRNADIVLFPVNLEKACEKNKQLNHAFEKPLQREKIVNALINGRSFNLSVYKIFPNLYFKCFIKSILKKLKIYKNNKE
jgi:hypothetical protein